MVVFVGLLGLVMATVTMSSVEITESRDTIDDVRARHLAQAGAERAMHFLGSAAKNTNVFDPLNGILGVFGGGTTATPFIGEAVVDGAAEVGSYTVGLELVSQTATDVVVDITATGYLPEAPPDLAANQAIDNWHSVSLQVRYSLTPSEVFNYAYFINNWGWLYGNTIYCNGNVRSNGQFDSGGYAPTITGQPTYGSVDWNGTAATLGAYFDSNGDGLQDGNDGGITSGWDIVNADHVQGNGGLAKNQHDFEEQIEMPNLSDLTKYENQAIADGGNITIGGTKFVDGVYGDDAGETGNLYLYGTAANPIVLDGPIVAQGDVIIGGYVTGQGSIYAGGNVYIPDSVEYLNPPTSDRPADNTQASTEAWLTDNWDKDFLGLFSAENIVVGDYTNYWWDKYVSGWMGSSMNSSIEDAGEDGIPNTAAGLDGILGTADDDVLEGDGIWTVEYYSAADDLMGLIPAGFAVGDPIPGSGEDIDGDGQFDGTTTTADLVIAAPLNSGKWGGNMPPGGFSNYSDISSIWTNDTIDAVLYTNHSFCYAVFGSQPAKINGALVCRNENIVYGTPSIEFNHDSRLLGGNSSMAADMLPKTLADPVILRWMELDRDPNRYVGLP